jgi:hypothetical protein
MRGIPRANPLAGWILLCPIWRAVAIVEAIKLPLNKCFQTFYRGAGGADLLLTVKNKQRQLYQQFVFPFRGLCNLIDSIRECWVGASWIVELASRFTNVHYVMTTLRPGPKALLRLVR